MKELSRKLMNVPKSGIRKLFDLLSSAQDTISLGIGQPDFKAIPQMVDATMEALKQGKASIYAPTLGVPELRQLVAEKFKRENGLDVGMENVVITPGGSGAITLAFAALFNPGDELVLSSPNFVSYFYVARYFDAKIVEVPRRDDLSPDLDAMRKAVTPKTKALLVNSPNNPTGYVLTKNEWDEIIEICLEHDLYLISDEVYEKFTYDGRRHFSPASKPEMRNRTITLNALSKTFSGTGTRVGYLAAATDIVPLMENFLQYTSAGVNHPFQYGGIAAIRHALQHPDFLKDTIMSYQERRDTCVKRLDEMGLDCPKPGGAFYVMPSTIGSGLDGNQLSEMLAKEKGVAVVPGNTFGSHSKDRIRISYALPKDKLVLALDRMQDLLLEAKD